MLNFSQTGSKEASGLTGLLSAGEKMRHRIDPRTAIQIQCLPLYSILAVLKIRNVDYFSLDVEVAELRVLKKVRDTIDLLSPYGYNLTNTLILDIILARNTTLPAARSQIYSLFKFTSGM